MYFKMHAYRNIKLKIEFYPKLHRKSSKVCSSKYTSRWPKFFTAMEMRDVFN